MARIVGNLVPEDDRMHPPGPESNWNESMYFNFFDRASEVGGFVRLGNRPNERAAEMTVALYLPDGRALFMWKRPEIAGNGAFDAGGLRFEVIEPAERLRTVYEGSAAELADPRALSDPSRAFREAPHRKIRLDLVHQAAGPMYGHRGSSESDLPAEQQFASSHYEQHMHVTGALAIGEQSLAIDGFGLRDHSWGPRYWQAIHQYEWLTMNFGPDLHAMVSVVARDETHRRTGGVLVRGDKVDTITDAEIDADYEDNGLYHRTVRARVTTEKGEKLEITGAVKGFIPLRNRREGRVTHIGEGMTEWKLGDRTGYGLSEFLRQVR